MKVANFQASQSGLQGGRGGFPLVVDLFQRAMGSRRVLDTDWNSLGTETLALILSAVWAVLRSRLTGGGEIGDSVPPPAPSPSFVRGRRAPQSSGSGLRSPFTCDFHCMFCESRCTRREGHTYHSCFEHRHRRQ